MSAAEHRDYSADRRLLFLTALSVCVGALGALVAKVLVWLIDLFSNLAYFHRFSVAGVSLSLNRLGFWAVLVPVAGGLLVGLIAQFGTDRIRGHGIPEALEAILIGRSRISPRVALFKPLASAIAIGTGGPFGAEGPIIMTGGAFGSLFAQGFHLTTSERKTLLVAGSAAGMAAIFAAPIAATLLAVELLLFEWKPRSLVPAATAALTAGALRASLLGPGPVFLMPERAGVGGTTILIAAAFGVVAGFLATGLTHLLYATEDGFGRLPLSPMLWPALGGIVVGLGGLIAPRALGVGYDSIRELLNGHMLARDAALLFLVKSVIWIVALGSGTSGGILAPLLLIGGSLGSLAAVGLHLPDPGLWAMLTMAALMGSAMGAPLTAVVFLAELTHGIGALPALLASCGAAYAVTVLLLPRSILTEKIARRGLHVPRELTVTPLMRSQVRDAMDRPVAVEASRLIAELLARLADPRSPEAEPDAWTVVDREQRLVGVISRRDLLHASADGAAGRTVGEVMKPLGVVANPDEPLFAAVERMQASAVRHLPVVEPDAPTKLVGMLGPEGIARAWRRAAVEDKLEGVGWLASSVRLARRRVRRAPPAA